LLFPSWLSHLLSSIVDAAQTDIIAAEKKRLKELVRSETTGGGHSLPYKTQENFSRGEMRRPN
jgi:predicted alpha-1,6-mannanase (GH76 family)